MAEVHDIVPVRLKLWVGLRRGLLDLCYHGRETFSIIRYSFLAHERALTKLLQFYLDLELASVRVVRREHHGLDLLV